MRFGSPYFFWLLIAIPALIGFFIWAWQQRQAALSRFASPQLINRLAPAASRTRHIVRWTLWLTFFFFLVLSLVRPRFGVKMEMIERKGIDIMVALDISESMLAEDITPNRLDRAKHEIGKFIDMLRGDRIGLIVFAGESFVQCPLTLDYAASKMFLDVVTTDWVSVQGTALAQVIEQATAAFHSPAKKHKVLMILTDGEDHEGNALEAAKKAAAEGVRIYTVGIGSESGVPIPVAKGNGNVVYKKDRQGNLVLTKLDADILQKIADEGKGHYFHAGTNLDLAQINDEIMRMEKKDLGINRMTVFEEQYQIFLAIALLLLVIEFLIPQGRKAQNHARLENKAS